MEFLVDIKDWRTSGVYVIINNVNGKKYIGSTTLNFRHRYLQYCSAFKRRLTNQPLLHRAFRKYGFDKFSFSILCITEKQEAIKVEQYYIDKGTDYNVCLVAGSLKGIKHSSNSKTRTVVMGQHHSAKSVNMYSMDNVFIKSFTSIEEAAKEVNIKSKSNICQSCKGIVLSAGGYKWSYVGLESLIRDKKEGSKIKVSISNNDIHMEFDSQKAASDFISSFGHACNQGRIHRSLFKTSEKVYGFTIKKI